MNTYNLDGWYRQSPAPTGGSTDLKWVKLFFGFIVILVAIALFNQLIPKEKPYVRAEKNRDNNLR